MIQQQLANRLLLCVANDKILQAGKLLNISFYARPILHLQDRAKLRVVPSQRSEFRCIPFNEESQEKRSVFPASDTESMMDALGIYGMDRCCWHENL
jgi:hypothetical protein